MNRKFIATLMLIGSLMSCILKSASQQDKDRIAIGLNNEALKIYMHYLNNNDSLKRALELIDSAILLKPDINFYNNKFAIARKIKNYYMALNACDAILLINNQAFLATLHKGILFEDLHMKDSQILYYNRAFSLIDSPKSFNAENMVKDWEKLIIKGLLKDTGSFNNMATEFRKKYDTSRFFNGYSKELNNFDRKKYLVNQ